MTKAKGKTQKAKIAPKAAKKPMNKGANNQKQQKKAPKKQVLANKQIADSDSGSSSASEVVPQKAPVSIVVQSDSDASSSSEQVPQKKDLKKPVIVSSSDDGSSSASEQAPQKTVSKKQVKKSGAAPVQSAIKLAVPKKQVKKASSPSEESDDSSTVSEKPLGKKQVPPPVNGADSDSESSTIDPAASHVGSDSSIESDLPQISAKKRGSEQIKGVSAAKKAKKQTEPESEQDSIELGEDSDDESDEGEEESVQEPAGEDEEDDSEESIDVLPKKIPNTKKQPAQNKPSNAGTSKNTDDSFAPSSRVFIRNLSKDTDSKTIESFFASKGLKAVDVFTPGGDGSRKGFAFAEFEDVDTATKAIELSGQTLDGWDIDISYAKPRNNAQGSFNRGHNNTSNSDGITNVVFVKNLPPSTNQEVLGKHFLGTKDIRVMTNEDGSCRGHAFVEFDTNERAKAAFDQMQGKKINGADVILDFAKPRGTGNRGDFRGNRSFGSGYRHGSDGGHRQSFGFQRGGGGQRFRGGRGGGFRGRGNDQRDFNQRGGRGGRYPSQSGYGKKIQFNEDDD